MRQIQHNDTTRVVSIFTDEKFVWKEIKQEYSKHLTKGWLTRYNQFQTLYQTLPRIHSIENNVIQMDYINGKPFAELVYDERVSQSYLDKLSYEINKSILYFLDFDYNICHDDINFNNIIIDENENVYFIDPDDVYFNKDSSRIYREISLFNLQVQKISTKNSARMSMKLRGKQLTR
jgi:RIO-like serine/threonine protein kinase